MREVIAEIEAWKQAGKPVAIATNVKRDGLSLRPLGAKMAMTPQMEIAGSVTGGCIEGAVYEEGHTAIKSMQPKLLHYGVVGDQKPWDIGLSCGSSLDVFVESLDSPAWKEVYPFLLECLQKQYLASVATVISGQYIGRKLMLWPDGRSVGSLGNSNLDKKIKSFMQERMLKQEADWTTLETNHEPVEVFVDVLVPEPRLIVIGASHIAIPLVSLAKVLGYHTIVIDPREAFATTARLPEVDELIIDWPSTTLEKMHLDEMCYLAAISHDEKLDNPALAVALRSSARYVGVLGTRKNIEKRKNELRDLGVTEDQLEHLCAPIGVPLGAESPEEIALSILGEMVAARHQFKLNKE